MADQGPFPDLSGRGVQGLFDPSQRTRQPATPTTLPSLPGSGPGDAKKKPPRRRRKGIRRGLSLVHVTLAIVALVGIARSTRHSTVHVRIPSFTTPDSLTGSASAKEVPASQAMRIVASGGPIANGVYVASGSALRGAGTATRLEFALTGRGARQHLVYVAGLRVRDVSCDHRPAASSRSGLTLYNDELGARATHVRGRTFHVAFSDGEESLRGTAASSRTIVGTFTFGGYSNCPAGGHFQFTASRDRSNEPRLATLINRIGG